MTVYDVGDDFVFPPAFTARDFKGLFHCDSVRGETGHMVLLHWRSGQLAKHIEPEVRRRLRLGCPARSGTITDSRFARPSLRPRSFGDTVVWISAVVGAWITLYAGWLALFANAEVTFTPRAAVDAAVAQDFSIPLRITNRSATGIARIEVTAARLKGDITGTVYPQDSFVAIEPNQQGTVILQGRIDQPGKATIEVDMVARSGRWNWSPDQSRLEFPITIWPQVARSSFQIQSAAGGVVFLQSTLTVGGVQPLQLRCEAWATGLGETTIVGVLPADQLGQSSREATASGKEAVHIKWTTPLLGSFTTNPVRLALAGQLPHGASWEWAARRMEWACEEYRP